MDLTAFYKSVLDQDRTAIVICDLEHNIIYMNPVADQAYAKYGGHSILGNCIFNCHNPQSKKMIIQVVDWFKQSKENNIVHTFFNEKQQKDVYMIALRDDGGNLIGYYEKHEYRSKDETPCYRMD